jgi:hypothetical protein
METTHFKKIIQYWIQWEMNKMDTKFTNFNKTRTNVTKEPKDAHKISSMRKSWKKSLRNSWRRH